jgi:predicted small lipoprotein YifL
MKHLFRSVLLVTLLALSGLLLSSCGTQGPSQSQVESINTEIKSQQPNNLGMAGPKKGGR